MNGEENKRVAALTTGAIKTTAQSAIEAMLVAVKAAEDKTNEMRDMVEAYVAEFEKTTTQLAESVDLHVRSCQAAIDSFQDHHLKILNGRAETLPRVVNIRPPESAA